MLRWISWALAVGLVMILGGCAGTSVDATPTPAPAAVSRAYPETITRWLNGVPCRAPCWEGITPGVTTITESLDLLGANQQVDLPWRPASQPDDWVDWAWVGTEDGSGTLRTSGETVSTITLSLPQEVILRDVIAAYGEPSHIVAVKFMGLHGDGPFYILDLAWEQAGFALETGFLYHEEPVLSADLPFLNVYFSPSPDIILPALDGGHELLPWQGFKDFSDYCRVSAGNPCS